MFKFRMFFTCLAQFQNQKEKMLLAKLNADIPNKEIPWLACLLFFFPLLYSRKMSPSLTIMTAVMKEMEHWIGPR